ncbi:D-alanyl-D-alanine carboxypeptidase [Portibacter marinus]|uniref:D-alanyl-D-alanine carboxypeptidase n=1 Tax=Portibacter marinus TaxID=2898660 RepID=UPI001F324FE9|nr:D-alanyl-D-alanine carboxypeptidase [Portibacter marinus]
MFLRIYSFSLLFIGLIACTSTKEIVKTEAEMSWDDEIKSIIYSDSIFRNSHTGLLVKPIDSEQSIIDIKSDQYFTPASNTKLLTFYTSLNVLPDRINGLKYYETPDSLIIWGTGDPSFLNGHWTVNDFIGAFLRSSTKKIFISNSNFHDVHYGSGWSWDDWNYGYQADKHAFPMYGNMVRFSKPTQSSNLEVIPNYFKTLTLPNPESQSRTIMRDERSNLFYFDLNKLDTIYKVNRFVPYLTSFDIQAQLLSGYLGREVEVIDYPDHISKAKTLKTISADSLYMQLLQPSDNFVAEQLLLNCGSELFDTMNIRKVIEWADENLFDEMPYDYQWVDGSGLSRYNITTPANMVHVLKLIYQKVDQKRLFTLLPTSGESGTIRNLYISEKPFIHAKTGSLRNNHSLSGYLIGDSGQVYVFSFMNSNYLTSNSELKKGMDRVLRILKKNL